MFMNEKGKKIKLNIFLFLIMAKMSIISFGGGSAIVPFMEKEFVQKRKWITSEQFVEMVTISNALPGASMVQMASQIGYQKNGKIGGLFASLGVGMPMPLAVFSLFVLFADKIDKKLLEHVMWLTLPVIGALMIALVIKMLKTTYRTLDKVFSAIVFVIATALYSIYDIFPSFLMIGAIIVSAFYYGLISARSGGNQKCQ